MKRFEYTRVKDPSLRKLRQMGQAGWELVVVEADADYPRLCWFKREIQEDDKMDP